TSSSIRVKPPRRIRAGSRVDLIIPHLLPLRKVGEQGTMTSTRLGSWDTSSAKDFNTPDRTRKRQVSNSETHLRLRKRAVGGSIVRRLQAASCVAVQRTVPRRKPRDGLSEGCAAYLPAL